MMASKRVSIDEYLDSRGYGGVERKHFARENGVVLKALRGVEARSLVRKHVEPVPYGGDPNGARGPHGFPVRRGGRSRGGTAGGRGGDAEPLTRGRWQFSSFYGTGVVIGLTPRDVDACTVWEFQAALDGWNRANASDDAPAPEMDDATLAELGIEGFS